MKLQLLILLLCCTLAASAQNKIRIGGYAGGGSGGTAAIANYIVRETPAGATNGSNTTFTLSNTPATGKEMVFKNGVLQYLADDYTISGATITMIVAPRSTDKIRVTYTF